VQGGRIEGGLPSWLAMAYIAVFPSFIAYLFFNRGIELVGAARAGQSWHLMPVFGSILAVLFLGETFYAYHAIGIALIAAGIVLASLRPAALPTAAVEPNIS
jgi:drug/metabolite transporter (DMT)-like permease